MFDEQESDGGIGLANLANRQQRKDIDEEDLLALTTSIDLKRPNPTLEDVRASVVNGPFCPTGAHSETGARSNWQRVESIGRCRIEALRMLKARTHGQTTDFVETKR